MNFSSDLCTLTNLTESTLLSSLENRYKDGLTESYVGSVLLSLGPCSKMTGPQFLPSFASSVLRSLAFSCQDQSILVNGHHESGTTQLTSDLLSSLLLNLDDQFNLGPLIDVGTELLDFMIHTAHDQRSRAVAVTTLVVTPESLVLRSAQFSSLLLDTCDLDQFEVFRQRNGVRLVEKYLTKLGMGTSVIGDVCSVLAIISDLLNGVGITKALHTVNISNLSYMVSEISLAHLLYAYLVQWIVSWLNSACHGSCDSSESGLVSLIRAPDYSTESVSSSGLSLSDLITGYAGEVLHNIYCTRLFNWEQEQYLEEGLEWETVEVEFNQGLLNTFNQDGGLLEVLGGSSVEEMRSGIERCCELSSDSCFMVKRGGYKFSLVHFSGECEYSIREHWLHANTVHMCDARLRSLLQSSSSSVLVEMAQNMEYSADVLPNLEQVECCKLTERAKSAMNTLSDLITTSQPHFVFSFKPAKDRSKMFSSELVLSQLQLLKIFDIALIQLCGYPIRLRHSNFLKNYQILCIDNKAKLLSSKEKCHNILVSARLKDWYIGNTMVLLKPWHLSQLDDALDLFHQSAKKVQRAFRHSLHKGRTFDTTLSKNSSPPSPPPRPSHTLSESHITNLPPSSPAHQNESFIPVKSPSPNPPSPRHKKLSWNKKYPPTNSSKPRPHSSNLQVVKWFQGKLSRDKAEELLKAVQFDCFMIRESESRVGEYALSLRHAGLIKHFRIDTKQGVQPRYELYGAKRSFSSLEVLVEYYSHHCVSSCGELLLVAYSAEKPLTPVLPRRQLSSMRRPKPSLMDAPADVTRNKSVPSLYEPRGVQENSSYQTSQELSADDSITSLRRRLEVEERIVEGARRMAELPSSNRRERQKRKQSLQEAQARLMRLRQQFHTLKQRMLFIEASMQNTLPPACPDSRPV